MKRERIRFCWVAGCFILLAFNVTAQQPLTGTPPLASIAGGSFDSIDLANLNVHFSIPVFSRPGRSISFNYGLSYNSLVWNPVTSGSTTSWQPASNWGWAPQGTGTTGYITFATTTTLCYTNGHPNGGSITNINSYTYIDPAGTQHPFSGGLVQIVAPCTGTPVNSFTATATDNSGLKLNANASGTNTVTTANGTVYTVPNFGPNSGSITDPNGNSITSTLSGTTTTLADTLGTALTVNGVAPTNPLTCTPSVVYQYTAPNNQAAKITVAYVGYIIHTNFNVPGIQEYGPTNACLVQTITMPDGSTYSFAYEGTAGHSGELTGRLLSVTLPTGGSISWSYANSGCYNSANCMMADGSPAWMVRTYGGSSWNYQRYVRSTQGWCGSSSLQTDTTVVDPLGNYTDNYFSGLYPTLTSVYSGARTQLLDTKKYCYNGNTTNCQCWLVASTETTPITSRIVFDYPNNGSSGTFYSETDTAYDTYGNLISETDRDFGIGAVQTNTVLRQTNIAVSSQSTSSNNSLCTTYNICSAPASVQITDGANQKALTTYAYDQGGNTHGRVTTLSRWSGGNSLLNQGYTYNAGGTVATATDVNGTTTSYTYNSGVCNGAFPTTVSVAGLSMNYTYNCTGGVVTQVTDLNGKTTTTTYNDPYFWRPASMSDPLSNVTSYSYSPTQSESVMNFNGADSTIDILTTVDSYGRPWLRQQRQAQNSGNFDTTQIIYDANSRVQWELRPFVSTAGVASGGGLAATGYTYDALGRTTNITDWTGIQVNYSYNLNDTTIQVVGQPSSESPKSRQFQYDGLGRLSSVCEITSASGSVHCNQNTSATGFYTSYSYDALSNLTGVNQSGQTRSYSYDGLSRMTSESNPESGTKTYQYDSVGPVACNGSGWTSKGDLLVTSDAGNAVTCYYYDSLHRVTDVGSNHGVDRCQRYRYDNSQGYLGTRPTGISPTNSMGRLVEAVTDTCGQPASQATVLADEWFSYDVRGQATDYWQSSTNSGGWYHVQQGYAANGIRTTVQGLTMNGSGANTAFGHLLAFNQDGEGRPYGSWDATNNNTIYWYGTSYNTASQPIQVNLTGSAESFQYDSNSGRMTQWKSYNSAQTQSQVGNLTWNANGTLQQLNVNDTYNSADNQNCTYGYDDLARLVSANCGTVWNQTFGYDVFGNITKSGSISFSPTYGSGNRISSVPGQTITYDSNGNMTTDNLGTQYSYDAKARPVSANSTQILYDAFGRELELNTSGSYTQVVYDPQGGKFAVMNGQTLQMYMVPLAAGIQAIFNSSGMWYYRHADWLGSSRLALDLSGNLRAARSFAPFGESFGGNGPYGFERVFTGQTQDVVPGQTANYDFLFRQLNVGQGRWLVPDPAGLAAVDITNPQTWNRYAYVGNSPLTNVDPRGLDNDCAGPCTPFVLSQDGNCSTVVNYQKATDNQGHVWDMPYTSTGCYWGGSPARGSVSIRWTIQMWDDTRGTGFCKTGDCLTRNSPAASEPAAANNGKENPRSTLCKVKVGAGIALDTAGTVAGLVPGAGVGLVITQVSLGLSSSAYSAYNKNVGFTIGSATGAQLSAVAAGAEYVGWKTAAKALPWVGTLYNASALAWDVYHAQSNYQACLAGD